MEQAYDICWDEKAMQAMRNIFNYLKKNASEKVANEFREQVFDKVGSLLEHPERYSYDRILMTNPPAFRSIPIGKYRVVYKFTGHAIFILFIYHTSQSPRKIKKGLD